MFLSKMLRKLKNENHKKAKIYIFLKTSDMNYEKNIFKNNVLRY